MNKTFHVQYSPSDIIERFLASRGISLKKIDPDQFEFEVQPEFYFDRLRFHGVDKPQKWSALGYNTLGLKVLVEGTITPRCVSDEVSHNLLIKGEEPSRLDIFGTMTVDVMYTELKGKEVLKESIRFRIDLSHLIPEASKMF